MSMVSILVAVSDDEIRQLHETPKLLGNFVSIHGKRITADLEKTWHGIHWLLTGSAWEGEEPLCYLVSGGQEVEGQDFGYGPPRTLSSGQVEAWDDALSRISSEELGRRFHVKAMIAADIYPQIWEEADSLEYLMDGYQRLKDFVGNARRAGAGLLVYLG